MQVVGTVFLKDRRQAQGILQGPPAVDVIFAVDAQPHGKIGAGLGLDVGQQLQEKTDAVFETAAVLVLTMVGIGGQETG
jgi:hypothetical protein